MRRFYIIADGEIINFQSEYFFHVPQGLGYGEEREYMATQHGFFTGVASKYSQPNITGEIIIRNEHYFGYEKLIEKLNKQNLTLAYTPVPSRTLYMDIDVENIGLSERDEHGQLVLPVSFRGKTPYYTKDKTTIESVIGSSAKRRMRFTFKFSYKFTKNTASDVKVIRARGHFPAALEAFINGPLARPVLKAQDANSGELLGVLDLSNVSLSLGEQIHYSSRANAEGVWKISGNTKQDIFNLLEVENNNFFQIPPNKDIRLTFSAETNADLIKNSIILHEYFKG